MRIHKLLWSVAILASTVSSSPARWFNLQWLEERSSDAVTPMSSELEARANPQLRILVAGASIAFGAFSSDGNGFRLGLENAVVAAGNDVQMVGTVRAGTMQDNACVAEPGRQILDVMGGLDAALPQISPPPNIILIQVGANDLGKGSTPDTMKARISTLVDHVYAKVPDANVILSTLLPSDNTESGVVSYNAKLPDVVAAQNQQGRHVYLADVHSSDFSVADIRPLPDGTHPTDAGYAKMAQVYAGVVLEIVRTRIAPPPAASTSLAAPEVKSTPVPEPVPGPEPTVASTISPEATSTSASPTPQTTTAEVTSSSQAQRQVAGTTSASSTTSTSVAQIAKELSSSSTILNLAASTTGSVSTPSASSTAKNGAAHFGHPGSLIAVVGILAWLVSSFAI